MANSVEYDNLLKKYENKTQDQLFGTRKFLEDYTEENDVISDFSTFEEKFEVWIAFYRKFPHVFVEDYFGITLKDFQIYALYLFMNPDSSGAMLVSARGIGKTFLTALYALVVMILYPGQRVVVFSAVKQGGFMTIQKIKEIMSISSNQNLELYEMSKKINESMNTTGANVELTNTSELKVISFSNTSRGYRASITIGDEFVLLDGAIYEDVVRKFLTFKRQPRYLNNPKYRNVKDFKNKQIFLSSARYSFGWAYNKFETFLKSVLEEGIGGTYSLLSFPYQVSVMSGLLDLDFIVQEVREEGFDPQSFAMEMLALWSGSIDDGYYQFDKLSACRTLNIVDYPTNIRNEIDLKEFKEPKVNPQEVRILTADIALMGSNKFKNDNTVLTYIVAYPNKNHNGYIREVRYIETISGGSELELHSRRIRELFYEFNCDYIVLDTNGIGTTVYKDLVYDYIHPTTGEFFEGLGCINSETMQEVIPNQNAKKVIYSFKASSEINKEMNSDMQSKILFRSLKLPMDAIQADNIFSKSKKYPTWTTVRTDIYKMIISPYEETDKLINEMINLQLVDQDKIKLVEQSGQRKDRFSSLAMGNYFITFFLEKKLFVKSSFDWAKYCASSTSTSYKKA